jgi:hypothetical protein
LDDIYKIVSCDIDWTVSVYAPYLDSDNEGQLLIYTGLFEHSDGALYNEPEEDN